jgi:cyclic beta-1,2-glucan synthetase
VFLPTLLSTVIELIRKPEERDWLVHLNLTGKSAGRPIALAVLTLAFLPYDTLICLGAILRSGVRMLFTRRGLLLWQLPSYARRNARRSLADFFREMWIAPVLAVALGVALAWTVTAAWLYAAPVLLLWLLSPVVGWWISRPLCRPPRT